MRRSGGALSGARLHDVAPQEVDADDHQRRRDHQHWKHGGRAILADHETGADACQNETAGAPRPHAAIVETCGPHAAHRHGFDQRHDGGPVEGDKQRCQQHLPEAAGGPEQQERQKRSPGEKDEDGAACARPIGGKTDRGRKQDAGEERSGEQDRDRVLVEPAPMEPHRHVGQVAANDDEQRGVEEGQAPGERGGLKARQTRHMRLTNQFEGPR
jgi:hypothetical protein